ncbi:hypothetical protein FRC03_002933 [Tulasnella sp. 419]|nr:hypothetical protein FRC03_002933 [Tulasnella sp. 419]
MLYAGTEIVLGCLCWCPVSKGNECWCSNTAPNIRGTKVADSDCSTPCKGDTSQVCGGGYRLNVYGPPSSSASVLPTTSTTTTIKSTTTASNTPLPTYTYLGCYTDSTTRTFDLQASSSSSMTNEICQSQCKAQNMIYAATEYGEARFMVSIIEYTNTQIFRRF